MRKQMSFQYEIGECTIRDILEQKVKLMQFAVTPNNFSSIKKYEKQQF